jgi:hypothetical protein
MHSNEKAKHWVKKEIKGYSKSKNALAMPQDSPCPQPLVGLIAHEDSYCQHFQVFAAVKSFAALE